MVTSKNYNVDLAKRSDKILMFVFAKQLYFDEKALGSESTKVKTFIRLLNSPAIMAGSLK